MEVMAIYLFMILPLTLVGTVLGRNIAGKPNIPWRISAVPRPIPEKRWFMGHIAIVMTGGILPFRSISIEMFVFTSIYHDIIECRLIILIIIIIIRYFIFTSFWNYKIYYSFGFMLLTFVILAIMTISNTILKTYTLLNSEDYRWFVLLIT